MGLKALPKQSGEYLLEVIARRYEKPLDYHDQQPAIGRLGQALERRAHCRGNPSTGSCTMPLRLPLLAVAIVSKTRYQRRRTRNQESQMNFFDRNQQSRDRITIRCSRVPVVQRPAATKLNRSLGLLVARLPRKRKHLIGKPKTDMNSSTSGWLALIRNFVAGFHPQNDTAFHVKVIFSASLGYGLQARRALSDTESKNRSSAGIVASWRGSAKGCRAIEIAVRILRQSSIETASVSHTK